MKLDKQSSRDNFKLNLFLIPLEIIITLNDYKSCSLEYKIVMNNLEEVYFYILIFCDYCVNIIMYYV